MPLNENLRGFSRKAKFMRDGTYKYRLAHNDPGNGAIDGFIKLDENSKKWKSPYMHHKICAKQKRDNLSALANRRLEIKRGGT